MPQSKSLISNTHKRSVYLRQLNDNSSCVAQGLEIHLIKRFYIQAKNQVRQIQAQFRIVSRFLKFLCDPLCCSSDVEQFLGWLAVGRKQETTGCSIHLFSLIQICNFEITVCNRRVRKQQEFASFVIFFGGLPGYRLSNKPIQRPCTGQMPHGHCPTILLVWEVLP